MHRNRPQLCVLAGLLQNGKWAQNQNWSAKWPAAIFRGVPNWPKNGRANSRTAKIWPAIFRPFWDPSRNGCRPFRRRSVSHSVAGQPSHNPSLYRAVFGKVLVVCLGHRDSPHDLFRNQQKGVLAKGVSAESQCHAQGNKKYSAVLGPAVHLALTASRPREAHIFARTLFNKNPSLGS